MNLYLKDWHHLKITNITMEMVVDKHTKISQTNKSHANITLKLFSAIYNYHRTTVNKLIKQQRLTQIF